MDIKRYITNGANTNNGSSTKSPRLCTEKEASRKEISCLQRDMDVQPGIICMYLFFLTFLSVVCDFYALF